MQSNHPPRQGRRGITVLTLLLLIIAVVIAGIFLMRYLRTRPAPVQSSATSVAAPVEATSRLMSSISSAV